MRHHKAKREARASLRTFWRVYQVEKYNAELRQRVAGKVPYDASIHEETLKNRQGSNPTTRIDLTSKRKQDRKGEQGNDTV